ncbi:preprotein translocase protein SecY (chloroplast) [Thalassiosira oceanica CCMP1005]|uniref:Preprotein translocase protein SecY n=1 Tax=Thalassiosira oceanica TaxID=159749 RepID=A0ACA6S1I2_THAOC|nr:preprotein translocase protein SecY [Thalassiosira oceanica CCMP1005]ADB27592.1 preprotein translocase protein SecY [Thalassiosira oceanica CCMP1005]|eukprot:ADB27592.1 preprotein translocase protein SecY (chloroplast) [Thalassiosira oceanica CCMP1005]
MKKTDDILLKRLLLSVGILLFIRMGTFLPIPGINHGHLAFYIQQHPLTKNLVSTFSGNDTFVIGLFTLNIFPYINASIMVQLITGLIPSISKLQKEGGGEGRRAITRLTRLITLGWALIQSSSIAFYLKRALFDWSPLLAFEIVLWLTTGAMIVLWLSEVITEYGLGNGASLLIYTNIISSLPNLGKKLISENTNNLTTLSTISIGLLFFIAIAGIITLQESARIVPLISSKQLGQSQSFVSSAKSNNYIPLRFNQAGVMPIILTTAILVLPNYIINLGVFPLLTLPIFLKSSKIIYWISYFALILIFSSFYSTIVLNPKDISQELQKMAVSIPGVRPGLATTFYLKQVMKRVTFFGAIILAILATLPNIIEGILNVSSFNGLGTTSLLILVGVVLDISREMKSIILSNIYNEKFD